MKKFAIALAAALTIASTGCGSSSLPLTYVARANSDLVPHLFKLNEATGQPTAVSIPIPNSAWTVSSNREATKVVYVRDGDSGWDVYLMGIDGVEKQLTTGADAWAPVFSPDGKTIAFMNYQSPDWQIYTMNADGTNTNSVFAAAGVEEEFPVFSPDGKSLVFDIWMGCNCAAHQHTRVQAGSMPQQPRHPLKSLNNRRPTANDTQVTESGIYKMAFSDSAPTLVYASTEFWGQPAFSGDGSKLLFTMYDGTHDNIYIVNLDGSSFTQLTTSTDTDNFSPVTFKGLILFDRWNSSNSSWDIYSMDQSGGNQTQIHSTANTFETLIDSYFED